MTREQRFESLKEIDKVIQECTVDYDSHSPYFTITTELNNIYRIYEEVKCCTKFDDYIQKECLEYIEESITASKNDLGIHIVDDLEKRVIYMERTLTQLKNTSPQCIRYLKIAYKAYCPVEI
ncbi:MAG: hypothetical protein H7334_05560 [Ferruginibacter sp.]|nr:hypothetical protein [Ferruginibacter sp.]